MTGSDVQGGFEDEVGVSRGARTLGREVPCFGLRSIPTRRSASRGVSTER